MELAGRRMYVYCATGGVVGVSADDGTLLWQSTDWTMQFATAPSPVVLPEGRIFLSSGYDNKVGSLMLQLLPGPDGCQVHKLLELAPKQFNSEQQTPILFDGHLIGVRKQGGGKLVCLDLDGKEIWESGKDRFGHGPYMIADGTILAMSNDGLLVMAEANTVEYRPLASFQVFEDGHDAWGPMALAGGRLIVRDMTRMTCLDLNVPRIKWIHMDEQLSEPSPPRNGAASTPEVGAPRSRSKRLFSAITSAGGRGGVGGGSVRAVSSGQFG